MEEVIFAELSHLVASKVYPMAAPSNTTAPYMVYSRVAVTPEHNISGSASVDLLRMQVDIYAKDYSQVKQLAADARLSLESGAGKATLQSEIDLFEPDLPIYRVSQDYYFWKRG